MKKAAIWGTGVVGQKVYSLLQKYENTQIVAFADQNISRQEEKLYGLKIVSPEHLLALAEKKQIDMVIFAFKNVFFKESTALFRHCAQLEGYIVPRYVQEFYEEYNAIEECLVRVDLGKPRIKQFDVNLVDHCNMKCKGCLRFSNLVDTPFFADFEGMIADWERMKELFWGVERLKLMGGEPMLSPDLCAYIKEARRIFPDADIMVTTNAILINENCQELFQTMKENYCFFDISLYEPMEKRLPVIEKILQDNGVWYEVNHTKGDFYKVMSTTPDYDMDEAYEKCTAKNCHHLREGKLSVCSRPQYAYIVNQRYDVQLPDRDGVWDIYHLNMDAWELDEKLSRGFEACRYCAPPESYLWGRADSKTAKMEDWFVG